MYGRYGIGYKINLFWKREMGCFLIKRLVICNDVIVLKFMLNCIYVLGGSIVILNVDNCIYIYRLDVVI